MPIKDEPFIFFFFFFYTVFSHLFRHLRIFFRGDLTNTSAGDRDRMRRRIKNKKTSCHCGASFSGVSCHTPTLSAGWRPDSQRLMTDMKTLPAVYLIKSILTVAQLPSAFNYDSFPNVSTEYQSQSCIAFSFSFFEGGLWAHGACAALLLLPSHFTHKELNEDQELNSCSLRPFSARTGAQRGLQPSRTHPSPSLDLPNYIMGPLRSE